jgi:hypothetical protein
VRAELFGAPVCLGGSRMREASGDGVSFFLGFSLSKAMRLFCVVFPPCFLF